MHPHKLSSLLLGISTLFFFASPAFAHVIVKPTTAGIASVVTFDMQIPSEKGMSTIGLKLVLPSGLRDVTPDVKSGWTVNVVKNGDTVTEIDWTGGEIPSGLQDDFVFSAQVPAKQTLLQWKAYQTYADGTVVNWDQDPRNITSEEGTPFATTKIINDLVIPTPSQEEEHTSQKADAALVMSIVAIIIASVAVSTARRKISPTPPPNKPGRPRKK